MANFVGIQIVAVVGALALAMALIFGLAPLASRIMSNRLRAELARDIQACRQNSADMLLPALPNPRLVRVAHLALCGLWLGAGVIAWLHLGVSAWPYVGLFILLLTLAMVDLDVQLLPGQPVGAVLWCGILAALFHVVDVRLADAVLGVVSGWLLFSIPNWLLSATKRGDDPAVGQGDISLLAACGAWLGPEYIVLAAGIALALALLVRVGVVRFVRGAPSRLPFGPLIALGAVSTLCISFSSSLAL